MHTRSIMAILLCCVSAACLAQAGDSATPAATADIGEHRITSYEAMDLRPRIAGMQLKKGMKTLYTNKDGWTLQAVVDRRGAITGYVQVDATGKASKVEAQTPLSPALKPGQMALVHKCLVVTQECINNPLPRSGKPEDCILEVECPKAGSFSNLLSR